MKKSLAPRLAGIVALAVAFAFVGGAAVAHAATPKHIFNAHNKLMRAQYVLQHSCHHLGGHRTAALKQVGMAINELQLAARTVHASLPAVSESGSIKKGSEIHPYIHDALRQCREAKSELASAKHHFGGHRVKAINHIDAAIAQLKQAVKEPRCKKH